VPFEPDPIFGLQIPASCPGVPGDVLRPNRTWDDQAAYEKQAKKLATLFRDNFKQFEPDVTPQVRAAGPA
jgi:phosphoenolpyruvate carboxykinase (ATP)